jgi:hypothetical protein
MRLVNYPLALFVTLKVSQQTVLILRRFQQDKLYGVVYERIQRFVGLYYIHNGIS